MSEDVVTGNWECLDVEHFVDALVRGVTFGHHLVLNGQQCVVDLVKVTSARLGVPAAMVSMGIQGLISNALTEAAMSPTDDGKRDVLRMHLANYFRRHSLLRDIEYYEEA